MSVVSYRLGAIGLACALVTPASAQLLARKDLSAAMAVTIAQTAIATCTASGYRVSATVVGRNGEVLVQIRGDGTDHGTATVALIVGGALKGGRVVADWPGLKPAKLHEGRDLKPTTDLRAVLKGLLKDHLRVDDTVLASKVFPDSAAVKPMTGLLLQA